MRYTIDPERSRVWIEATSSLHPIHTGTAGLEGFVDLELDPSGRVDLRAAVTGELSLPVRRLTSGHPLEDRELLKRIDVRRHPTIDGVLQALEPSGEEGSYLVSGVVSFRGVSRPHRDTMTIGALDDRTVTLAGSSRFDVRHFGMEPPRVLLLRVDPEVRVRVEILATTPD